MSTADRLRVWLSSRLYRLAYRIEPPERGEPCVDCGVPLPAGYDPDECPTCRAAWEETQRDKDIWGGGYQDGWREAEHRFGDGCVS